MTEENKETRLSDEEVWLRAYLTAMSLDKFYASVCEEIADDTLIKLKKKFRNNND